MSDIFNVYICDLVSRKQKTNTSFSIKYIKLKINWHFILMVYNSIINNYYIIINKIYLLPYIYNQFLSYLLIYVFH